MRVDGKKIGSFDKKVNYVKQKKPFHDIYEKTEHTFEFINKKDKGKIYIEHIAIYIRVPIVPGLNVPST